MINEPRTSEKPAITGPFPQWNGRPGRSTDRLPWACRGVEQSSGASATRPGRPCYWEERAPEVERDTAEPAVLLDAEGAADPAEAERGPSGDGELQGGDEVGEDQAQAQREGERQAGYD